MTNEIKLNRLVKQYKATVLANGCKHNFVRLDSTHVKCTKCSLIKKVLLSVNITQTDLKTK